MPSKQSEGGERVNQLKEDAYILADLLSGQKHLMMDSGEYENWLKVPLFRKIKLFIKLLYL